MKDVDDLSKISTKEKEKKEKKKRQRLVHVFFPYFILFIETAYIKNLLFLDIFTECMPSLDLHQHPLTAVKGKPE